MAKKRNLSLGMILPLAAAVLALLAFFIMMFSPAATYIPKIGDKLVYTGGQLTFGYSETTGTTVQVTKEYFAFSFANLLSYLLLVAGVALSFLAMSGKKSDKLLGLIAAVCFLAAGIFFLCVVSFSVLGKFYTDLNVEKNAFELGAGAILAGIFSISAAITVAVNALLIKKLLK